MSGQAKRISAVALAALLLASAAPATEKKEDVRVQFSVSRWAYQRLNEAHELINKNRYAEALKVMESMKRRSSLNDHERALMFQTFGYIYANLEKMPQAISSFEECLALGALPEGTLLDLQFSLGQLYMANNQFQKSIGVLSDWMGKAQNPSPDSKYLLAMAYTQVRDFRQALVWARQAIAAVPRPKENWLRLLLSIHHELKQFEEMAAVLKQMVARFPCKAYWMQLSMVYTELKQDERALAVLELADMQGFLQSHSEQMNLVSLLLQREIPFKAAQVLERGLARGIIKCNEQTLTLLGDSWMRAREFQRAIKPLSEAAELSDKGDLWVRVAQIHMERQEWARASAALERAMIKKLANPGNAHLLLGICQLNSRRFAAAKKSFDRALEHQGSRRAAEQWLNTLAQKTRPGPQ